MRRTLTLPWLSLLLSAAVPGDEAPGAMPQLMQLNRASQQELADIQDRAARPEAAPSTRPAEAERLNRRQHTEQTLLQEDQRREVLMQKQRARVAPAGGRPHRLRAIDRQSRFRLQQQHQLNRFRGQQGRRGR